MMYFLKKIKFLFKRYTYIDLIKLSAYKFNRLIQKLYIRMFWHNLFSLSINKLEPFGSQMIFFSISDKAEYLHYLKNHTDYKRIISESNNVINHVVNLLGSGEIELGSKINWQQDFKSGFVWPKIFYQNIQVVDLSNNADVKVPWELSRFQYLALLGQAYWLTGDEKYVNCFQNDIEDWIQENPVGIGINWTCTMEVAIRAVNWIIGYFYFSKSVSISRDFWGKFNEQLYLTGKFIIRNLEYDFSGHGNNHYLSNLAGLFWLGLYFGDHSKETKSWLEFSKKKMEKEIIWQFNHEGTNFEASIPYHRLSTEIALSTMILAEKNGIKFNKECYSIIEKSCEFTATYTKPNGLAPQIGDADDGRFHIFTNYGCEEKKDHRHLLAVGGVWYNKPDWIQQAKDYLVEALWFFGSKKVSKISEIRVESNNELKWFAYSEMGFYIVRDHRIHLVIRCGPLGQAGNGGHAHNDQLSFELNINGENVFIDPGTYVYTADYKARNRFRSTGMHNTIQIGNYEQNQINDSQVFQLLDRCNSKALCCVKDDRFSFFGEHCGYVSTLGVIHKRTLTYYPQIPKIEILDEINKGFNASAKFILGEFTRIESLKDNCVKISGGIEIKFSVDKIKVNNIVISNSYGVKTNSYQLEIAFNRTLKSEIILKY